MKCKHHRFHTKHLLQPLVSAVLLACHSTVLGANGTWVSPVSGNWFSLSNWSSNPLVPNGIDDIATLGPTTFQQVIGLDGQVTLGSIVLDSPFAYSVTALTGSLTLQTSAGNASITITDAVATGNHFISTPVKLASSTILTQNSSTHSLTMSGAITGNSSLTINGPGTVTMSGASSAWSGDLFINNPSVIATNGAALGTGTATLNAGGTLSLSATTSRTFTLNGGAIKSTTGSLVSLNGTLSLTADSLITTSGNNPMQFGPIAGGSNLTLTSGNFTVLGNGTGPLFTGSLTLGPGAFTQLTGGLVNAFVVANTGSTFTVNRPAGNNATANSLAPGALIANGGLVGVSSDVDFRPLLAPGSVLGGILINATSVTFGGTNSLDLNSFANSSTLRLGGNGSLASSVDIRPDTSTHTFHFGLTSNTSTLTVNGSLADHDASPANLDIGAATTILSTASSYTGVTTVNGGTLQVNNALGLGVGTGSDSDGTIVNGGTLRLGAGATVTGEKVTLNAGGTLAASTTTSGGYANLVVINGGTLGAARFTGMLSGSSNFNISGSILAGTGSYTGTATFIGNATVSGTTALSSSGNHIVSAGSVAITAAISVPIQIQGGTVLVSTSVTSPFTLTSGSLKVLSSGNVGIQSVTLSGGLLSIANNLPLAALLSPTSTSGAIAVDTTAAFTSGTSNSMDFSSLPGGANLVVGSTISTSIASTVVIRPDSTTNTLHFGGIGLSGTLSISPTIVDFAGIPTNVSVAAPSTLTFPTTNSYTGLTTVGGILNVSSAQALGSGSGGDSDGTAVNSGGTLRLAAGVTLNGEQITLNPGGTLSAVNSTSTYASPIVINGGTLSAGRFTGVMSGTGSYFVNGSILAGSGTSTGSPTFNGNSTISSTTALGAASGAIVAAGTTALTSDVTVPFTVSGGQLFLAGGTTLTASVTLNSGSLSAANSTGTYNNVIQVNGGSLAQGNYTGVITGSSNFNINGSILAGTGSYTGNATFTGDATIGGANALSLVGNTIVSAGTVNVTAPVNGPIQVNSGLLKIVPGGSFSGPLVKLNGGFLSLAANVSIHDILSSSTTRGVLSIDTSGFVPGADAAIDFSTFPAAGSLTLGSTSVGSIDASVPLIPESTTHTLRFGGTGAGGTLTVNPAIVDFGGIPTHVSVIPATTIVFPTANSYSGITTITGLLQVNDPLGLGSGTGSDSDGTLLNAGGRLVTGLGVTLLNEKITASGGSLTVTSTGPVSITGAVVLVGNYSGVISGPGSFTTNSSLTLSGPNTFTGSLTLNSGANVLVNSGAGLGSAASGTLLSAGTLTVAAASPEPVTVAGGVFNVTGPYLGSITQTGGTTNINASTLASAIVSAGSFIVQANFAGSLTLNGGTALIQSSTSGPLSISGGTLSLSNSGSSPINQTGGLLILQNGGDPNPHGGSVTVASSTLQVNGAAKLGVLSLSGISTVNTSGNSPAAIQMSQLVGTGSLVLASPLIFNGPINFNGVLAQNGATQYSSLTSIGHLTFNAAATVNSFIQHIGDILVRNGGLSLVGNVTATGLTISSGGLFGNGTLALTDHLQLMGGTLGFDGSLAGGTQIDVSTANSLQATRLPTNGTINVLVGELQLPNSGYSGSAAINVSGGAQLTFSGGGFSNPLNFASDVGNAAALRITGSTSNTDLSNVHIGMAGVNVVSMQEGPPRVTFSGVVTGGPMTIRSGVDATFRGSPINVSALTVTAGEIDSLGSLLGAGIHLQNTIASTGPITIANFGSFFIDNTLSNNTNRIPDNAPIYMAGGWLEMDPFPFNNVTASETLGAFTLSRGYSRLVIQGSATSSNNTVRLTLASFTRNEGAVLVLQDTMNWFYPAAKLGATPTGPHLMINGQADTNFLGGGIVYGIDPNPFSNTSFVKYSATNGVTALTAADYYTGSESTWSSSIIPLIANSSTVTLSGSRNVLALKIGSVGTPPSAATLDLADKTLNVQSGGMLMPYDSVIKGSPGNRLTAGGTASSAELFVHSFGYDGDVTISANITDNPGPDGLYDPIPGGPLDADNGKVAVVFSEYNRYQLSGNNTYTGATYLTGTSTKVFVNSSSSFPAGPIFIDSGTLTISVAFTANAGPITLRTGAIVGGVISPSSITIESGQISSNLSGNGTITKTTTGTATISNIDAFTGSIAVMNGTLRLPTGTHANPIFIQNGILVMGDGGIALTGPVTLSDNSLIQIFDDFGGQQTSFNFSPSSLTLGTNPRITFQGSWFVGGMNDPFTDTADSSKHVNVTVTEHGGFAPSGGYFLVSAGVKNIATISSDSGSAEVGAGAVINANSIQIGGTLNVKGTFALRPGTTLASKIGSLTIAGTNNAWTGTLDIADHAFIIQTTTSNKATTLSQLANQINSGKHNGDWLGTGITSSTVAVDSIHSGVGLFDNGILLLTNLGGGNPNVDNNSIFVAMAHLGDANRDGIVDHNDLNIVSRNLNKSVNGWTSGDLNYDGTVNSLDATIIAANAANPLASKWNKTAGNWSDATRWSTNPLIPNNSSPAPNVLYDVTIEGGTVTLDINSAIKSLTLSTGSLTGSGSLTVGGGTVTGTYNLSGPTTIASGILEFGGITHNAGEFNGPGNLQIDAGVVLTSNRVSMGGTWTINGTHIIRQNTTSPSKTVNLTLSGTPANWTGKLDLTNNALIVVNGASTPGQLKQGANLGSWNGIGGITSSAAQAAATGSTATALAYATGTQFTANNGQTTLQGITFSPTDTLILYTLAGDANMDKSVTFADFLQLQNRYNQAGTDWPGGDFNYDGSTTFADFLILQNNYNKVFQPGNLQPATAGSSQVPEPSSLFLLAVASSASFHRRRRGNR